MAYARRTDPQEAHDAAASLGEKGTAFMERVVLRAVASRTSQGANWMEQCVLLPNHHRQTISPRWKPLRKKGFIEYRTIQVQVRRKGQIIMITKKIVRPGWSGRMQTVWYATELGHAMVRLWSGPLDEEEAAIVAALDGI